jgi:opine dehydrogenase
MSRVTVLGGGNTAFSIAARLSLGGHEVMLWEHPDFAQTLDPILGNLEIELKGTGETGRARLAGATIDAAVALAWADMLVCSVPSYAHQPFADRLLPHLRSGHVLALLPGDLGSLAFAQQIRQAGIAGVVIAEADTAPYVCRKTGPAEATIWGTVSALGIGVFPASQTGEVVPELAALFPGATSHANVLAAGLSAMNPIVHPPGVLMNAGRVERSRGEFWFYEEGVTPSVARVIEALDAERLAVGRAFGLELMTAAEGFHAAGFGPKGDLWSVINGSRMLTSLRAPGSLDTRWLTEDVPFGIATWAELAGTVGVDTPLMNALIALTSAVVGFDCWTNRRTVAHLGIGEMSAEELLQYLA